MAFTLRPDIAAALNGVVPGAMATAHRDLLSRLPDHLGGDPAISIVCGAENGRAACLVLQQTRVLLARRGLTGTVSTQDLSLTSIASVELNAKPLGATLDIRASGASIELVGLKTARARQFAEEVRSAIAQAKSLAASPPSASPDLPPPTLGAAPGSDLVAALKELAAMHESGVLTAEQYEMAKNKLLSE